MSHKALHDLTPLASDPHLCLKAWQNHLSTYALVAKASIFLAHRGSSSTPVYLCLLTLYNCSNFDLFRHLDFLSLIELTLKSSWILVFVSLILTCVGVP